MVNNGDRPGRDLRPNDGVCLRDKEEEEEEDTYVGVGRMASDKGPGNVPSHTDWVHVSHMVAHDESSVGSYASYSSLSLSLSLSMSLFSLFSLSATSFPSGTPSSLLFPPYPPFWTPSGLVCGTKNNKCDCGCGCIVGQHDCVNTPPMQKM